MACGTGIDSVMLLEEGFKVYYHKIRSRVLCVCKTKIKLGDIFWCLWQDAERSSQNPVGEKEGACLWWLGHWGGKLAEYGWEHCRPARWLRCWCNPRKLLRSPPRLSRWHERSQKVHAELCEAHQARRDLRHRSQVCWHYDTLTHPQLDDEYLIRNYDYILANGKAPSKNIYYNSNHINDIKTSVLYVNNKPNLITLDYFMDVDKKDADSNQFR